MPRVTITIPDKKPQPYRFQLDRKVTRLGRGSENDIVIDCASVSVHHAEMERVEGGFQLRDIGSTNGIKIEGERREVIPLRDGLTLKIGDVAFDFQLSEEELDALSREKPMDDSPIIKEDFDEDDDYEYVDVDEDDEDDEEKPKRRQEPRAQVPKHLESTESQGAAASFAMTLILFVLAVGAFWAGMEIRHRQKTASDELGSRSLVGEILDGSTSEQNENEEEETETETPEQ
jgi:pSer/pThr/pTyr-binding forkhead associated (FHA) protein